MPTISVEQSLLASLLSNHGCEHDIADVDQHFINNHVDGDMKSWTIAGQKAKHRGASNLYNKQGVLIDKNDWDGWTLRSATLIGDHKGLKGPSELVHNYLTTAWTQDDSKTVYVGLHHWGSLDQELLAKRMDDNASLYNPKTSDAVMKDTLVESALGSAKRAIELGMAKDKIVVSAKVSKLPDLLAVYKDLYAMSDFPLHLGLTEAGLGIKGIVSSAAAISILLNGGIGDTIRVSLTPQPDGDRREEVHVAQQILQSLGVRAFSPEVIACPGCGRTTSTFFQELAQNIQSHVRDCMRDWSVKYPGCENLNIAVMGCVVNGPGESEQADIGISLPGNGEKPVAPVFIDGKRGPTLKGENIINDFKEIISQYVKQRYGNSSPNARKG